jgi:hypothetical protein
VFSAVTKIRADFRISSGIAAATVFVFSAGCGQREHEDIAGISKNNAVAIISLADKRLLISDAGEVIIKIIK